MTRRQAIRLAKAGRRHTAGRRGRGFSLVTVAGVGAVTMIWLFAISAAVLPMYQRAATGKHLAVLRSAAEAGLDYTIAQINNGLSAGVPSPLDDGSTDGTPVVSSVPADALGNSGAQVVVAVNNLPAPSTSSIYDASWASTPNHWRVVTATATYAGFQRSIRVILKPEPGAQVVTTSQVPYFQHAMFGKGLVALSGNAASDGYDSRNGSYGGGNVDPYGGDVGSNTLVTLGGNTVVGGDLIVYSQPGGSTTQVVATAGANSMVSDRIEVNGITSGFTASDGPTAGPGDNVLAGGQGLPIRSGDYTTPIDSSQSMPALEMPPAKGVPPGSQVVTGSINWTSGSAGYVSQPTSASQVVDMGSSLSVAGNKTVYIRPGDYKISALSVGGNGKIVVLPNSDGSAGIVRFFVEGNTAGANVIQIAGNGIVNNNANPKPHELQFWYNGNKDIKLTGNGQMYAVMYAPNANIEVGGNGTLFGGIVGNNVDNHGNGMVHFDKALLDTTTVTALAFTSSLVTQAPSALKARSWQEI